MEGERELRYMEISNCIVNTSFAPWQKSARSNLQNVFNDVVIPFIVSPNVLTVIRKKLCVMKFWHIQYHAFTFIVFLVLCVSHLDTAF